MAPEPDHRCRRFPPRRRNETTVLDTASTPTQKPIRDPETATPPALTSTAPKPAAAESSPAAPTAARPPALTTGAIRALGSNPATAPIMLHPGDAIPHRRRVLYIVLLGALTALGPFTIDLYLPAFPVLEADFQTTAAAIQLTLTGTMIGFALGQLIVGPLSDKVGRRIPLLAVTALHVVASVAAALAPTLDLLMVARVGMGMGAAAGGVVAMAIVRDLFGGRRLVVMLSRLALVSGVAPVLAPLIGSALLAVMPWRGIFVVLAIYGAVMLVCADLPDPRDAAASATPREGQHHDPAALQERLQRPGVHRRAHHRRHDLQRPVLVPLAVVVPVPAELRLRRAAVRDAVRRQLPRRRPRRAGGLAPGGAVRPAVGSRRFHGSAGAGGGRHHRVRSSSASASGARRSRCSSS